MNNAGAGKYNLIAGSGTDTLWGGSSDDIITIAASGQGDADTLDGYGGTDILQLSAGTHTFTTNDNMIKNIEEVKVDTTSGSTVDLTNQTEGFKITVGGQTDSVTGSDGNDIIVITSAGDGNNDTLIGGSGDDVINLSAGSHTFSDDAKLATIETINANASATTLDLTGQLEGFTIAGGAQGDNLTGGSGNDIITGGGGDDTLKGGAGNDTLNVDSGSDIITLLGGAGAGGEDDVFVVSNGATATAANIINFVATTGTTNAGTAILSVKSDNGVINMSQAPGVFEIRSGAGPDTLVGGSGNDTFKILNAGEGNSDTINGGDGTGDKIILSSGSHSLTDNSKISNIEIIDGHASSATTLTLGSQAEGFTINGGTGDDDFTGAGDDTLNGNAGDDTLSGGSGGNDTFNVTLGTDTISDLATGDILVVSNGATANATITSFDATFATRNDGAATLTAKSTGGVIDLENATVGTGTYTIKVGAGTDTITGSKGDDIIEVVATTQGNADTLDGGLER